MKNKTLRLEWLDPNSLQPNPHNWRKHPDQQKKILDAVLTEVGWAGVALYNETTERLIDGHARREWAISHKEATMPVLVGAWCEADEKKLLATLDPIAALAEQASELYRELLQDVETDNEDLASWCDGLISSLQQIPFDSSFEPDKLTVPDIVGADTRMGRFILVFQNDEEKTFWAKRAGIDGKKVIYTVGESCV